MKFLRILCILSLLAIGASLFACAKQSPAESSLSSDTDSTDTESSVEITSKESVKESSDNTTESIETEPPLEKLPYRAIADEGFEDALADLKDMVRNKYKKAFDPNASKGIRLTFEGATENIISAKTENGELVIRATDAKAMKKALTCFWYENIAYADEENISDVNYSKDLSTVVFYSDFNADASGGECCFDEIIAAHDYANANGYKVFADYGARYYLTSTGKTAKIKTDVEWGDAKFTIDDSIVTPEGRDNWIFSIVSDNSWYGIDSLTSLDRDMTNLGITLDKKSIVTIIDDTTTHYIRKGGNADNGQAKRDMIVVDADGSIDMNAPLMWDFDNITSVSVLPIDTTNIKISGGEFTTIANQAPSEYTYYNRGLCISRSNVTVSNLRHYVIGEGATGAPYNGFFFVGSCAYVNIENCVLTGHKTYQSPTTAMGSYDFGAGSAISVTLKNCTQSNDINDTTYWGVMGTNYCKNLTYDGCSLSRFDAHKGVANATIKNSTIGHGGATIIGYGTMLIENSTFYGQQMLSLRSDFGSSWEGDIIIRNSRLYCNNISNCSIIVADNSQDHDFGYTCYMPKNVIIEGLYTDTYLQTYVFNVKTHSADETAPFPYIPTESVSVIGCSSLGTKNIALSPKNNFLDGTEFNVQ